MVYQLLVDEALDELIDDFSPRPGGLKGYSIGGLPKACHIPVTAGVLNNWVVVSHLFLNFHPGKLGEDSHFDDIIFFKGVWLKPPTR